MRVAVNPPTGGFEVQVLTEEPWQEPHGDVRLLRLENQIVYHVYVLINPEGKLYIGQTSDLERRLAQHNEPSFRGTLHTKRYPGPWRLIHAEAFTTRSDSMRRERQLKSAKGRMWIRMTYAGGC